MKPARRSSLPWLPWYHRDFIAATQGWGPINRHVYFMLLCAQWDMGPLANNQRELARIADVTPSQFRTAWKRIASKFKQTPSGLVNERLESHRAEAIHKSEAARLAALTRWHGQQGASDRLNGANDANA